MKKYYSGLFLYFIVALTIFVYWQGLQGGFIFDDFPNLQDMGAYGTIDSWSKVRTFITNGFSGPTGRPLSLLSFLINDNTWPSQSYSFKYTNLMIHILNGILLFWTTLLLLRNYNYKEQQAVWVGLVASSIWLIHPYFVSTTLYVIQRMAELATLFSLIGFVGYLSGRLCVDKKPKLAYMIMSVSMVLGIILATLSKENGALLPLLVLVIEYCNPDKKNKPSTKWLFIFLYLPSFLIILYLCKYINISTEPFPNRNFNMMERLYSETRIVAEYLYDLFVPKIELKGLFQDGFVVSRSILHPITTLYSTIFLIIVITSSFVLKKKYPLYTLAVLFFFSAHLMESTFIGLELYFEHRNYSAALFLFLPVASVLYWLRSKIDYRLVNFIVVLIVLWLGFFTHQRTILWSNTDKLQLYWARNSPDSARAQNAIATILYNSGHHDAANQFLEQAVKKLPKSSLLNLNLLLQKVYDNTASLQDFVDTEIRFESQPLDAQALQALRFLVDHITEKNKMDKYGELTLRLIANLDKNPNYHQLPVFQRLKKYLDAKIYLGLHQPDLALKNYIDAVYIYNDVEPGLMMVAELGSDNYPKHALNLLEIVKKVYAKQSKESLHRSVKEYNLEFNRIELLLQHQIAIKEKP